MSFKQYLRSEITKGLDETYTEEAHWAQRFPGKAYFDVQLSTIEQHERATPLFREFLGRGGMKILESGCGTGRWMAFFEKLGNQAFGIDDSPGPLRVAREHDPDMRLVRADVLHKPFRDGVFDAVFSSYVAEHFEDGPEALFREIHRVLKPGGLFFVVVPYNNNFRRLLSALGEGPVLRLMRRGLLPPHRAQAPLRVRALRDGGHPRDPERRALALLRGHLLRDPRAEVGARHTTSGVAPRG